MGALTLEDQLAQALPEGVKLRVYHISTPPTTSTPIFSAAQSQAEQHTRCESHFLGISSPEEDSEREVFIFAIEILIFSTDTLTTVFVSKADSSGFISRLHLRSGTPSISQTITTTFLDYLLAPRLNDQRLVLSLFARSQNQYLFPGSVENAEKHVLDDRQLIKWWCRVLDSVWRPYDQHSSATRNDLYDISAHVVVPGCDNGETKALFPPSHAKDSRDAPKWINGYPVQQLSLDTTLPLRCLIPRLPDDPKSRFLNDLDANNFGSDGQWRSVKSMDQFWEMMSYRQECSAGRLVGFIWVVFSQGEPKRLQDGPDQQVNAPFSSDISAPGPLPTPGNSQRPLADRSSAVGLTEDELRPVVLAASPPPSSPIVTSRDEHSAQSNINAQHEQSVAELLLSVHVNGVDGEIEADNTDRPLPPSKTPGEVVINATSYEILIESLLEMDFAGSEMAAQSTHKWLAEIAEKGEAQTFGKCLVGKKIQTTSQDGRPDTTPQVNMLMGVRKKKRKPEDEIPAESNAAAPQVLSASLVRKKSKVDG